MKLKGFSLLGVKKQQFLFMKKLTYRKRFFTVVPNMIDFVRETHSHFTSWFRDPFFEGQ